MKFPYVKKESRILGHVYKPLISMEIFSHDELWYGIDEVLIDTGADITLIPKGIGEILVGDITNGKKTVIKGIGPFELTVYIHNLKMRIARKEFYAKVAIATLDDVPAVLGRVEAIDIFDARFVLGRELVLE